ncbi:Undecaprenyl phosphate-alpha-4-amino-4-deoxy-L-arabinose arabinosyl transferase [compost metagenome]
MIVDHWKKRSLAEKVFVLFVITICFRAFFSLSIGLIDDEAYHWSWIRDLQLSYFDHPAMVAWLEALSTRVFGDTVLGVRFPSFVAYVAIVVFMFKLTKDLFDEWAAYFVGFILLWSPFWGFGGYVASPEPFFMLAWVLGAWVFWQGVREDGNQWSLKKTWIYLGIIMGLGLNSKFIIALLAPGFGLYLLMTPSRRKDLLKPWPWVGFLIATVLCAPIFAWNIIHDWPGFKYQFHDRHSGSTFNFGRWLGFFAAQWLFYTPFLYVLLVITFINTIVKRQDARWRYLFCLSVPSLIIFYPQPFWADFKPHWSGAACTLLLMGAGAIWSQGLKWGKRQIVKPKSKVYTYGILGFFIPLAFLTYTPFAYPWIPKAFRLVNPHGEWKTVYDPSNEFHGWEDLGRFVNRRQREIHAESGRKPFIAAHRYETTAQTTWGVKQKVYMLSSTVSQYTVMQSPEEMSSLKGQDAIFVSTEKYNADPMEWAKWDSCSKEELKTFRHGEHARTFNVYYCKNFQGITN